jgi:hypothetical protein
MSDRLTPPPPRPLPPEVRDRIRGTVTAGLERSSRPRIERLRAPLAVAASVAVLAAGAAIIAQSVGTNGGVGTPTTAPTTSSGASRPTLNPAEANAELDRCWAAVQQAGKAGSFPDRSQWQPVFNVEFVLDLHVTAARAAGKPLFCATTLTTVTVSDPNATPGYAKGSRTGSLLFSPTGIIAGVADPSWPAVRNSVEHSAGSGYATITPGDHLFVTYHSVRLPSDSVRVGVERSDGFVAPMDTSPARLTLPAPPPPAVSIVDRPVNPPDRTSERGHWFAQCLASSTFPVPDPDVWEPGASVTVGGSQLMIVRNGSRLAYCERHTTSTGKPDSYVYSFIPSGADGPGLSTPDRPVVHLTTPFPGRSREGGGVVMGAAPGAATRMQLVLGSTEVVDADVWNSTFAAALPAGSLDEGMNPTPAGKIVMVRVYDANNAVIYEGPLDS